MGRVAYFTGALCFCLIFFTTAGLCHAVDPYDNVALPHGFFLSVYPAYYKASKLTDKNGETISTSLASKAYMNTLRLTYYNKKLLKNTLAFTVLLPAGRKEVLGHHDSGIGDLSLAAGYWFLEDPASKTWLGAGSYMDVPTGGFDRTKKANMGSNVWKVRPIAVFAKQFGGFDLEMTLKYNIYTKNHDTGLREGNEIITENYLGYFIKPNMLLGGVLNGTFGADKVLRGVRLEGTSMQKFQAGPSIYWKPSKGFSVTVDALAEFSAKNTSKGYLFVSRLSWRL